MNSLTARRLIALPFLIAGLALCSCTDRGEILTPPTPPSGPGAAAAPASTPAPAAAAPTAEPERSGTPAAAPSGASKPGAGDAGTAAGPSNPDAPPAAAAGPAPADDALMKAARELAGQLVAAIEKGDADAARALLITRSAFDANVAPAYRTILGSSLLTENDQVAAKLVEALGKKKIDRWEWKPGLLTSTPTKGVFKAEIPHITESVIELEVGGIFVEVDVNQLLHVDGRWQIFRLSLP